MQAAVRVSNKPVTVCEAVTLYVCASAGGCESEQVEQNSHQQHSCGLVAPA